MKIVCKRCGKQERIALGDMESQSHIDSTIMEALGKKGWEIVRGAFSCSFCKTVDVESLYECKTCVKGCKAIKVRKFFSDECPPTHCLNFDHYRHQWKLVKSWEVQAPKEVKP